MSLHKLLQKQLEQYLGHSNTIPHEWAAFIRAVHDAYVENDAERARLERICGATGDAFFHSLVELLAKALEADYAFVGEIAGTDAAVVRTLAVFAHGEVAGDFIYPLSGTPFEEAGEDLRWYPRDAGTHFPEDRLIRELGVECFIGMRLRDAAKRFQGVMAVMGRSPLRDSLTAESMLRIFAVRAAAELERRRAEEALRQSQQLFHSFMSHSPAVAFMKDERGRHLYVNKTFEDVFGVRSSEVIGQTDDDLFSPATSRELRANDAEVFTSGRPLERVEVVPHADGPHSWLVSKFPILDAAGRVSLLGGVAVDITGRKRAEENLSLYRQIFANSSEATAVLDPQGRYLDQNAAHASLLGYADGDLFGQTPALHLGEEGCARLQREVAASGRFHGELPSRTQGGDWLDIELSAFCVRSEAGEPLCQVMIERDLSERRALQARLLLTDRLASMGTLAAGVAHEINNPLAYVMANIGFARSEMERLGTGGDPPEGGARHLREIRDALTESLQGAERVRQIVRDLKVFSRGDEERRDLVDLHRVIESSINIAWNEIRERARLVKELGDVPLVEANEARLGQVFLNLLVNAAQAIPEGESEAHEIRVTTRTDLSGKALIEIRDTGSGIPRDIIGRIFDPFFTTKPATIGTGLGLSVCHGIVASLGGEIGVESEIGAGSTFRVLLPPAAVLTARPEPPVVPTSQRRGRILLVDDEPMLGTSVRRALASEHDVEVLTSSREALARIADDGSYDVILCDLMMPGMTGMELHAAIAERWPDLAARIIFLTGGAYTAQARAFLDAIPNGWLEKPFDMQNMRALLRDHLARRG
jgi:PAS domain S-box-containing protein